jgi:hypothetical protein
LGGRFYFFIYGQQLFKLWKNIIFDYFSIFLSIFSAKILIFATKGKGCIPFPKSGKSQISLISFETLFSLSVYQSLFSFSKMLQHFKVFTLFSKNFEMTNLLLNVCKLTIFWKLIFFFQKIIN